MKKDILQKLTDLHNQRINDNKSNLQSISDLTRLMLEIHLGKLSMESIAFINRMNIDTKKFTKENDFTSLK